MCSVNTRVNFYHAAIFLTGKRELIDSDERRVITADYWQRYIRDGTVMRV